MTCCQSLHRARVFQLFDARTAGHRPLTTGADGAFHNAILRWIVSRASGVDSAQARIVRISSTLSRDTIRRFTVYQNCPLPTPEDRLLFILTYLKTYALQVVHGRLFGMVQGKANQWLHVLLPAFLAALRALGDAPARSLPALAQRLGVSEADAATVVVPLAEEPAPVAPIPAAVPASPLLPMTGRNDASSAPKTLLNRKRVIAARKKTTQ